MVAIHTKSLFLLPVTLIASYVSAYGQIAQVVDAKNFCVFLPPADSVDRGIADTEWNAQAFCIGKAPLATNAGKLNSGFIQSAHYLATDKYVQVTGKIDPSKARLNVTDEGGQYDIKAPKGSSCAGWKFYVNLVEPAGNTYCMRCCNDDRSCNRGISEKGCAHIIPGDYSGPEISSKSTTTKKVATVTKTTSIAKTTTVKTKVTTTTAAPVKNTNNNAAAATTTTTTAIVANGNTDTSAANVQDKNPKVDTTPTVTVDNTASNPTPNAAANPAPSSSSSSSSNSDSQPNTMLSQNEKVSEQSVSGSEKAYPNMIAVSIALVLITLMYQQ